MNSELQIGYHQGIRDPSLGERFGYVDWSMIPVTENQSEGMLLTQTLTANSSLNPETSETVDMGWRWTVNPGLKMSLQSFLRTSHNLIEIDMSTENTQYVNRTKNHFKGIEGQIYWHLMRDLDVKLGFLIQKSTADDGGNLLERPNILFHTAFFWQHSFFKDDLNVFFHLNYRFLSEYWCLNVENFPESYPQINGPAHLLDVKVSMIVIKRGSITFAIDNVLDTEIHKISLFPMPGRSTRIGFAWELFD